MRIKVGIAMYQSKALFKGFCHPSSNLNFIKGKLHNQKKKIQRMNSPAISNCLGDSRCDSFLCPSRYLNVVKIFMDKHTRILSFATFWAVQNYGIDRTILLDHLAT